MKMNSKTLLYTIAILLAFVLVSCVASEIFWSMKDNNPDSLRQVTGLPSLAVGNLNPSARNPGIEIMCTGMYDVPGGFCNYFSMGASFVKFPMATNFTVLNNVTGSGK
jgi:hypothetical protein